MNVYLATPPAKKSVAAGAFTAVMFEPAMVGITPDAPLTRLNVSSDEPVDAVL